MPNTGFSDLEQAEGEDLFSTEAYCPLKTINTNSDDHSQGAGTAAEIKRGGQSGWFELEIEPHNLSHCSAFAPL